MSSRVFVSSTCFDLLDIRSEVGVQLREMGFDPIMSDDLESDFAITTAKSSIEKCLVNVDNSEYVVVILSKRYGPSLGKYGYDDISATHLEYNRAVDKDKRILFYVRDRLEADFNVWRANQDVNLPWIEKKDEGILRFFDQHKKLTEKNRDNWYWTFRNSIDLKARIAKDLRHESKRTILSRLLATGTVPVVDLTGITFNSLAGDSSKQQYYSYVVSYKIHGALSPFHLSLLYSHDGMLFEDSFASGPFRVDEIGQVRLNIPLAEIQMKPQPSYVNIWIKFVYTTVHGYRFADNYSTKIKVSSSHSGYVLEASKYLGKELFEDQALSIYEPEEE